MSRRLLSRSSKARNARSTKRSDAERRSTQRRRLIAILGGLIIAGPLAAIAITVDSNIPGTPTVKINGQVFTGNLYSVGPLTSAVGSAREGK